MKQNFTVGPGARRRDYGVLHEGPNIARVVRVTDGVTTILAETPFNWAFDIAYPLEAEVADISITCKIGPIALEADDVSPEALRDGGVALVLAEGALSANDVAALDPERPVSVTSHFGIHGRAASGHLGLVNDTRLDQDQLKRDVVWTRSRKRLDAYARLDADA